MSISLVGFRASERIPANTLFRISLADYWYNASSFTFPDAAKALYQKLYPIAQMIPTTALGVITGDKVAVFDANLKTSMTGAELVAKLEAAGSQWAFVEKIERLSGSARESSSSDSGMEAREDAKEAGNETKDAEGAIAKFLMGLGFAGSVVKWAGIGITVGAVLYFGAPYLARKK